MRHADLPWHALPTDAVMQEVGSGIEGLASREARERLEAFGPNRLPEKERPGPLLRFLRQFDNVLIYVLLVAAVGTAVLGLWVDTAVIAGVVVINAAVGFVQEGRAEKALEAIRGMLAPKAQVMRDGHRRLLPAEQLVPGDLVSLTSGDRVPADVRIVRCKNLRIEEAVLTGESVAVEKRVEPAKVDAELGDRKTMAFAGTLIAQGRAEGVVVATGSHSEIGKITKMLEGIEELSTPLLRQVAAFGRWLAAGILLLAGATFAFGAWVRAYEPLELFLAAVSIAVAAIPEGLPAIMTITLAVGVRRMAERNAIVRRLPAVETLGSVTAIYSDKTGTLTRNEMTVKRILTPWASFDVGGVGYAPHGGFERDGQDVAPEEEPLLLEILRAGALCNDAELRTQDGQWRMLGDPTEGALVTVARKAGLERRDLDERFPRTDVLPFDSSTKFMATLHHDHEGRGFLYLKGAPERVLELCARERTDQDDRSLDSSRWREVFEAEAARGQRLLALAMKECASDRQTLTFDDVAGDLTFLGVVGIIDPPRDEAIDAVTRCHRAGIAVKMITGDHAATATAIAHQLGIDASKGALTGRELDSMDDRALERLDSWNVFARATPEHKLRLVRAAQEAGKVVAMTGDGVNDAPALKRADVGIAMGVKGTEAAKEASEIVLADDNFATIAHAVEAGRTIYDNLRKTILFLLPTNGGQAFTIVLAIALGVALPLSPVQVLWVNMVTAVTLALALTVEPTEPGVMTRKPRDSSAPLLSGFLLWRVLFVSALLVAGTFGHFVWMRAAGASLELARTVAINTLVAGQLFYLLNSRFILESSLSTRSLSGNRAVLGAIGTLVLLQLLFTYLPAFQSLFETRALQAADWGRALGFGALVFLVVEAEKAILRRIYGTGLR